LHKAGGHTYGVIAIAATEAGDSTLKSLRFAIYAFFLLAATASYAKGPVHQATEAQSAQLSAHAKAQIEQLMAEYHRAVVSHDGTRLASMFIDKGSWFNVLSNAAYARAHAENPAALKVRAWTFQQFAKVVSSSHAVMDPQHSDVRILTDGTIASVYFKYVFLIGGKPENQGTETWQLVKASDGWKIAAITYSSNPSVLAQ
jgi:ketosteroid isomerase-like protein